MTLRTRLCLAVIGLTGTVWSSVAAGNQASPDGALPASLRSHLAAERLDVVTSIRGLPLGVRGGLQTLFEGSLDIAEPGAPFQGASGPRNPNLPLRRLIAAGCSIDHCLIYYEKGGAAPAWPVALFHWTPDITRLEWGGAGRRGLTTIAAVRKEVLSGSIQGPNKVW